MELREVIDRVLDAPGTVALSLARDEASAVVRIRDTGVGIRPATLSSLFVACHQETQDVARTAGGLGLGLALAKGLVELHHGTIAARSEGPGKGAAFEVRLPLTRAPSNVPIAWSATWGCPT